MKLEIEVPENVGALAVGLGKLVADIKQALSDGFHVGGDASVILGSVLANFVPHISKMGEIEKELKAEPMAAAIALQVELKKAV